MSPDIKNATFFFLSLLGNVLEQRASILMYHSVAENKAFFTVHPKDFERQLKFFQSHDFTMLPLSNLIAKLNTKSDISKIVVLTFDDGYQDNYEHVFPLLLKYQVPATIFLVTGAIGSTVKNSEGIELPILTKKEIQEMEGSNLIEFMPHTREHIPLTELSFSAAIEQVESSRKEVEELTGKAAPILSYPKGRHAGYLIDYLKEHNWLGAVTVNEGLVATESNKFILPRNSIDSTTTFTQFKGKISPVIDKYVRLKSWVT